MKSKSLFHIAMTPVVIASLCCLSPILLVSLGLSSVAFAASLADVLYGEYKWMFRVAGLIALVPAVAGYLRSQRGICTLDDAVRRRNEVLNVIALSVIVSVTGYLFFLYVVVHYAGVLLKLWA